MIRLVLVNEKTGENIATYHTYAVPRQGEYVVYADENEEPILVGNVVDVHWQYSPSGVLVHVMLDVRH